MTYLGSRDQMAKVIERRGPGHIDLDGASNSVVGSRPAYGSTDRCLWVRKTQGELDALHRDAFRESIYNAPDIQSKLNPLRAALGPRLDSVQQSWPLTFIAKTPNRQIEMCLRERDTSIILNPTLRELFTAFALVERSRRSPLACSCREGKMIIHAGKPVLLTGLDEHRRGLPEFRMGAFRQVRENTLVHSVPQLIY